MIKYLLPLDSKYYKANLHSHTTVSDGEFTLEKSKNDYMAHGYSVVAYTDHDKFVTHEDMCDENFVALNGFELEYDKNNIESPTCHLCFISKDQNKTDTLDKTRLYHIPKKERPYDFDYINADIALGKEEGFFVTYNHPSWSLQHYPDYSQLHGMDAMEISNYNAIVGGYNDDNGRVYDDFLELGQKLYCIAADDNHNRTPEDGPYYDSFGGYVQIAAKELNYKSIIDSLEAGYFYTCATINPGTHGCPTIKNLWVEDGAKLHVEVEDAVNVIVIKDLRHFGIETYDGKSPLTSCDFNILGCNWFRVVVTGFNGNKTCSNAFFTADLKSK